MTQALYIMGGAGTGKSTLMEYLIDTTFEFRLSEPEVFHRKKINICSVGFTGQRMLDAEGEEQGVYLGTRREKFPGTDALDRACGPVIREWMQQNEMPAYLFGEGNGLTNRPFFEELEKHANILVVHLVASDEVKAERFAERGSAQAATFVAASATRADSTADRLRKRGVAVETFNTGAWTTEGMASLLDLYLR